MLRLKKSAWESAIRNWTVDAPFADTLKLGDELSIHLAGFSAEHPEFGGVTGSAADAVSSPQDRAYYELLERISILETMRSEQTDYALLDRAGQPTGQRLGRGLVFPKSNSPDYQFAKSNGVALHRTWDAACLHAVQELVERHIILASWLGLTRPLATMEGSAKSPLNALRSLYELKRVHFAPQAVSCLRTPISVSAVALLPRTAEAPLIVAFGAGESTKASLAKAESEAIQRLGFLWGEEIPTEPPEFAPTALYHQEYHLMPSQREMLEGWLSGAFFRNAPTEAKESRVLNVSFVDLTAFRELGLPVAKAYCPEAIPLVFGKWREREFKNLPESLLIHPIA